ncbi:AMP-binding protein, partial [Solihabitans fulvus]
HQAPNGLGQLVSYVVLQPGAALSSADLLDAIRQDLPPHMVPQHVVFLDAFPLNDNGKVDRGRLPLPEFGRAGLSTAYRAPRAGLETTVAEIFLDALGVPEIGADDDFFELGGDSISAARAIIRIRPVVDPDTPLRLLFDERTVANVARALGELTAKRAADPSRAVTLVSRDHALPLSSAQQQLWFLHQLDSAETTYNEPTAHLIRGELDVAALGRAVNALAARHETLRTYFVMDGDSPAQRAVAALTVPLPVEDLRALPEDERHRAVHAALAAESRVPFDFARPPLFRVALFRMRDDEWVLFVNTHHIVTDGWSSMLMISELGRFYAAESAGGEAPGELPFQYADYAVAQRQRLADGHLDDQISFWRNELADAPTLLELRTDRPRPPKQTDEGNTIPFVLDQVVTARIRQFCREHDLSVYMFLLSVFSLLLNRYTGQRDLVVGTAAANRHQPGLDELIGFFVNILPVRVSFAQDVDFRTHADRVREKSLAVYDNQEVPFDRIVQELRLSATLNHPPLVQVVFAYQNRFDQSLDLGPLSVTRLAVPHNHARYDLTLYATEREDRLDASVEYNTDLFDQDTITRLIDNFETLLGDVLDRPDTRLSELTVASAAEAELLAKWNDTATPFPSSCLHELFEVQAAANPDRIAVVLGDTELTYRELDERANQLAHLLQEHGVRPDSVVGLCVERSPEMVIALIAILKAGGAYLPLDPEAPANRLNQILTAARAVLCLVDRDRTDLTARALTLDAAARHGASFPVTKPASTVSGANLVSIYYTSGSTGMPKGVANTHTGWVNRMTWMQRQHQLKPGETILHKTTLTFDDAALEIFWPLAYAGTIALLPPGLHRDPRAIIDAA